MNAISQIIRPAMRNENSPAFLSTEHTIVWLDGIANVCLTVAILIVPLMMAGIPETGVAVFVCCSLLMGFAWAISQLLQPESDSRLSGAEYIVLGAMALVSAQLLPWPASLLSSLSPFLGEYLALWGSPDGRLYSTSSWPILSLTPSLTRSGMVLLVAYSVFFLVLVQRLRTVQKIDQAIRLVAIGSAMMAVIGLAQLLIGNGRFLWFFEHPFRDAGWPAKGTFTNQNHFAHFLALGIGPLIWWWHGSSAIFGNQRQRGVKPQEFVTSRPTGAGSQKLLGVAIALVALAGLLSMSRGGVASLLIATLISLHVFGFEWRMLLKLVLPATLFVFVGVLAFGTEALVTKWESISNAASLSDLSSGRYVLWKSLIEAIPNFWITGSGLGSHAEVYPIWLGQHFDVRFSHAECGYLQVFLELGLPGLVLLFAGICLSGRWVWKTYLSKHIESRRRITVLAAGLIVSVVHSTIDFVWYIPGCMILTLVLAACACRCYQLEVTESASPRRSLWPSLLAWIIVVMALPVGQLTAAMVIRDARSESDALLQRDNTLPISDRIAHLENCVRINATDYSAMSTLAGMYLHRFELAQSDGPNRMSTLEIKNTVQNADFESDHQVAEWLFRAFGDHSAALYRAFFLARKAVCGQPLRGDTYLVIARLGFLVGISSDEEDALLDQAIRVRPHSPTVLYHVGLTQAEKGDVDRACSSLSEAFALDPAIRPLIVRELAPYLNGSGFIERIAPQADGLWYLFREFQRIGLPDQQVVVADWYTQNFQFLVSNCKLKDVHFWQRSHEMFSFKGQHPEALAYIRKAAAIAPQNLSVRKRLAMELLEIGELEECRKQLNWCHTRDPDDKEISLAILRVDAARNSTEGK